VGEEPEIASFKPWFKDAEEPKPDIEKKEGEGSEPKKEDKKEEHWQDEKFLYKENYGETMTTKKQPSLYVFDT